MAYTKLLYNPLIHSKITYMAINRTVTDPKQNIYTIHMYGINASLISSQKVINPILV